jgi:ADP-ribosyl-[dinitrogen reductase] hydrolase
MNPQLRLLFTGLALGDALGATSEFVLQENIPELYERYRKGGWPRKCVGGGVFNWDPGEPTDDTLMAWSIVRAYQHGGTLDPDAVAASFVEWFKTSPKDIGSTIRRVLGKISSGVHWSDASYAEYLANPSNAPNGALMRNGVIPGIANNLNAAYRASFLQGIYAAGQWAARLRSRKALSG